MQQLKTKIGHCEKELKERKSQLMSKQDEAVEVQNELGTRKSDVERVKKALESLPIQEGQMEALEKVSMVTLVDFINLYIKYTSLTEIFV